jgi:GTP-binding protein
MSIEKQIRVVILGRPNVGKSTLFNRLYGRRRALVHDEPGVTRDRLEENTEWWIRAKRVPVTLIDTGGVGGERFAEEILQQVRIALSSADAAIFLMDGRTGVTAGDEMLLQELTRTGVTKRIPVICAVNKIDDEKHESMIGDFFGLGLDPVLTISAEHDRGMDDLKEAIAECLELDLTIEQPGLNVDLVMDQAESEDSDDESEIIEEDAEADSGDGDESAEGVIESGEDENVGPDNDRETDAEYRLRMGPPRIAIVGRPNVGKSTFVNALLNENRMIVSPIAGTTVDAIDSLVKFGDEEYLFVDTAGIRRKGKTEQGVEVLSVVQTRKALSRADVAILMLDGESGIIDQDAKISSLIEEAGCGVILVVNKWDTQRKNQGFTREMGAEIVRKEMAYLKYAPVLFISAKEGKGFDGIGDLISEILKQRRLKIPTHEFTEWVREEATIHNPANAKFFLCHQSGRNPPSFVCHVNDPDKIHFSLKRHLVNAIRERWGFMGSPVRLHFVEAERKSLPKDNRPKSKAKAKTAKRRMG